MRLREHGTSSGMLRLGPVGVPRWLCRLMLAFVLILLLHRIYLAAQVHVPPLLPHATNWLSSHQQHSPRQFFYTWVECRVPAGLQRDEVDVRNADAVRRWDPSWHT